MNDEEFFAKLLETFRIEAEEHLKALADGLLALEGDLPQDQRKQKIEYIFREAHSLKGASRAVNQHAVEKICQSLENILASWKQEHLNPSSELFDILHATIDLIGQSIAKPLNEETIAEIIQRLEDIKKKQTVDTTLSIPEKTSKTEIKSEKNIAESQSNNQFPKDSEKPPLEPNKPVEERKEKENDPLESQSSSIKEPFKEKFIRVSLQKMNQVFQEAEEMLMVKLISQQQVADLKQLYAKKRIVEKELAHLLSEVQILQQTSRTGKEIQHKTQEAIKKVMIYLNQQQREMKITRENLNKLIKISEQNTHFVESMVDVLLEDMKKILMQPMNILFEAMPRMIRNIAHELGKEIQVYFQGGDIEVDRRILEEIKDPLIHLIRNAIDHGIETPDERKQANKSSFGTIKILAAESSGNNVVISIIDDGKGMNIEKLKDTATKQGLLSQIEAKELTEDEAIKLAFHSGISTSPIITELSGRGLGLGIVSEKVDRLGGQVVVESKINEGTKFTLILPLTLATFRGIHISVSNQDFIMPTHNVKRVLRVRNDEIRTIANCETISVDNHSIPYVHLADLLGLTKKAQNDKSSNFKFILLISAMEKMIAFGADDVLREQEVLVKGLGKQCIRVKNMMAATVMEWGNVIPILNPIDLVRSSIKGKMSRTFATEHAEEASLQKEILLVEDSITTRLLLKNILESAGYAVKIAVDGLEALEILRIESVDLLLTDVEMPRMDGFTLVEKVREMDSLKDIPIIICTSRGSKEDRERGIELGANAYLDKSLFTQEELINILKKLV